MGRAGVVVPTPYQQGTELDCKEKRQLGFKEPWRVYASSLVTWEWHSKTEMPSLWLKSSKGNLSGGRQTRPLPGLGGSNIGSGSLKGGMGSQRDLGWQLSQSPV